MSLGYTTSRLWRDAFSDNCDDTASTLAAVYRKAWHRACEIAGKISTDAPGLTLHDERHFLALWRAADLLISPDAKLTPIEVFIFGVAVLIHDAAHTTLVYSGGLKGIKETNEWKDNLALRTLGDPADKKKEDDDTLVPLVLFDTVRAIHAKQAEQILRIPFRHPAFDENLFLIDDPTIRNHMNEVIGKIAASHHWSISDLVKLNRSLNVVSPYNKYGVIRPMLLAALMRTADAIQIDNERAPDFEFALMQPKGVSADHWKAQNQLAIGADGVDAEALLVNSTASFQPVDAQAWWIAYDLSKNADRELRSTDALLSDHLQPRLTLKRVKDIGSVESFCKHVKTEGWKPVDTEFKITSTKKIIEMFGGAGLYGDDPMIPLRELVQNSVDAVRARRLVDSGYSGKISLEIDRTESDEHFILRVSDDGLGMSLAMLTGPLLTFGESGWSSSALVQERVGFVGRRPRRIGKYGIGFFSIFMIADHAKVISRPFDQGGDSHLLEFTSGVGIRPSVRPIKIDSYSAVTKIELRITASTKDRILNRQSEENYLRFGRTKSTMPEKLYTMSELVGAICPLIDVDIEAFDCESSTRVIVPGNWKIEDAETWVCRINDTLPELLPAVVRENIDVVDLIQTTDYTCGRAAISPSLQDLGVYAVGGLASKKSATTKYELGVIGCIDRLPEGPKRDRGQIVDKGAVATWATNQANTWAKKNITAEERNIVSAHTAMYGGDCSQIANAKIDDQWLTLQEIYTLISDGNTIYAPIRSQDLGGNIWRISDAVNLPSGHLYHRDDVIVDLRNVLTSGNTEKILPYWIVNEDSYYGNYGFMSLLLKLSLDGTNAISVEAKNIDFGYYCGETIKRERRVNGERIIIPGIEIKLADA